MFHKLIGVQIPPISSSLHSSGFISVRDQLCRQRLAIVRVGGHHILSCNHRDINPGNQSSLCIRTPCDSLYHVHPSFVISCKGAVLGEVSKGKESCPFL